MKQFLRPDRASGGVGRIARDAAAWAARVDGRVLTESEQAELDSWLAADSRHLGAFARCRAVLAHTERVRALGPDYDPANFAPVRTGLVSRRVLLGGGLAAASAAVAVVASQSLLARPQTLATERGEIRLLPLQDGSVMTLNTASRVELQFRGRRRHVGLLEGEAFFDVAGGVGRPFVVRFGELTATATDAAFSLRRLDARRAELLIRDGAMQVTSSLSRTVTLGAGRLAEFETGRLIRTAVKTPEQIEAALGWRTGLLSFEGVTLAAAIAEFARYSDLRIEVPDDTVSARKITGLFSSTDPAGFAKAAAAGLDLRLEPARGGFRILSR